jgi:hypothetical protein
MAAMARRSRVEVAFVNATGCCLHQGGEGGMLRAHHVRNEGPLIGEQYVEAAVRLWREYFWPYSRAALRQIGLTEKHSKARRVLCWIRTNRKAEVSLPVVALTEATAAVQSSTGALTICRRHNKPSLGPPGDSLDDFTA